MNNTKKIIDTYKREKRPIRNEFKYKCKSYIKINDLLDCAADFFYNHWWYIRRNRRYKTSYKLFKEEIIKYEQELFKAATLKEVLEILYRISVSINGKGLGPTFHYDLAEAIAFHNGVKIDKVYLNNPKTKKAFKNFLGDDYDKKCIKYRYHHCFLKEDLAKKFAELEEDEIEDWICINSDLLNNYNWNK